MHYFANFDQRVDSVKHRWMCCWLLVADCWLLVAGCWLLVAGPPSTLSSLVLGHQQPRQRVWPLREVALGASPKFRWCIIPCTLPWYIIPCGTSGAAGTAASCVRLYRVYNWVRAKVTDGGGWVWQAQENMSLFSLKHPRVADHALWWDICHWIFVLIK